MNTFLGMNMMKFQFEVRSKTLPCRTWNNTIDFCIDHDHWIPQNYQQEILNIASNFGVYRKISMLDDKRGMLLYVTIPTNDLFSEWLATRINYFHEVKNSEIAEDSDEIPFFPNSFQKRVWDLTNFTPLISNEIFWRHVDKAFELAKYDCKINLRSFNKSAREAYNEFYN